ncbi:HdeD family acid-resistance protein [Sphingomonas sp. DT-204]|uniref:HdeD family acid-resistance protein n=1 Tax=Sphingomonas sp. DT-204 TaxID=3396166 RepID=UPI003F1C209A
MAGSTTDGVQSGPGWGWILLYGIVSLILGLLAFAWPFGATLAATFVVACFLIAAGIAALAAGAFGRGHEGRLHSILFGLLSLVVGLMMAFRPLAGAFSLTLLVAAWLIARGVMELVFGVRYRRHRWLVVALGVIDVLLGFYVVFMLPLASLAVPGFILGMSFVLGGVIAIMQALSHRKGAAAFAIPD